MLKIGLSSCGKKLNEALFADYAQSGLQAMEISPVLENCGIIEGEILSKLCELYNKKPEQFEVIDFEEVQQLADKYNITLWSFHLPFAPFELIDISSEDETFRRSSVELLAKLIKKAASIGISKYIIHPSVEPIDDSVRKSKMEAAKKSLKELCDIASAEGGMLCVENLPRTCLGKNSTEMKELVEADPRLGICFDTNHLLSETFDKFIADLGKRIVSVHISDYDFTDEMHWLPGEGDLDWNSLYTSLIEVGYNGPWLYELTFRPAPGKRFIQRSRDLICSDFVKNAKDIFAGNKLPKHI